MSELLEAIAPEAWLIIAGVALLVGAGSFAWGRRTGASADQIRELTGALDDARAQADSAREELESYRGNVADHFAGTSEKLRDLTLQYRSVYDHIATGAGALCPDSFEQLEGGLGSMALSENSSEADEAEVAPVETEAETETETEATGSDDSASAVVTEPPIETDRGSV